VGDNIVTRRVMNFISCPKCGAEVICPECNEPILYGTEFSQWLRKLPGYLSSSHFSCQNLDYIWHNYKADWFITIEEKRNGGKCTSSQLDTHRMIYQMLKIASDVLKIAKGVLRLGLNGDRKAAIDFRGHYVIIFEKSTPDNSTWILINKQRFYEPEAKEAILTLLRTGQIER
jgi:hypothetical protein